MKRFWINRSFWKFAVAGAACADWGNTENSTAPKALMYAFFILVWYGLGEEVFDQMEWVEELRSRDRRTRDRVSAVDWQLLGHQTQGRSCAFHESSLFPAACLPASLWCQFPWLKSDWGQRSNFWSSYTAWNWPWRIIGTLWLSSDMSRTKDTCMIL